MAGPISVLRSLLFYVVFYLGSAILVLGAAVGHAVGERYLFAVVGTWSRFHRLCVRFLLGIAIERRGHFPRGGALVAIKHESFFDALDLPALFDRPFVIAKAELRRVPIWGPLAARNGLIMVERDQGSKTLRKMLTEAKGHLAKGRVFVIFPEGTRVPHGTAPDLQAGFAALYKALDLPVVPVALNSGPLYHRRWKRPGKIIMSAGEPIPPGLPRAEIEARVHEAINALNG